MRILDLICCFTVSWDACQTLASLSTGGPQVLKWAAVHLLLFSLARDLLAASRSPVALGAGRPSVRLRYSSTMPQDFVERTLQFFSGMDYRRLPAIGGVAAVAYTVYRRYSRISLDDVPGPDNPSFLYGVPYSSSQYLLPSQ